MRLFLQIIGCLFLINSLDAQRVAINEDGEAPDPSAILDISANDKGFLAPRMTTTQRNSISSPATGLIVFDTEDELYYHYTGADDGWAAFEFATSGTSSDGEPASPTVGDKYYDETGGLYIYTTAGWASITGTAVDSPYGTIDMVFGTASGNSITISSWNESDDFDGYLILMNTENSFSTLSADDATYLSTSFNEAGDTATASYASNGEQIIYDSENSKVVSISVVDYEKIYYFKMVPYSVESDIRTYTDQASVFVTTSSCSFDSGVGQDNDDFDLSATYTGDDLDGAEDEAYEVYYETVESQVCFSVDFDNDTRIISSNQWPDHYMGTPSGSQISGEFPVSYVVATEVTREVPLNPTAYDADNPTFIFSNEGSTSEETFYNFGIAINGVEFHPMGVDPWIVKDADGIETAEENWAWQTRVVFQGDVNVDPQGGHTTSRGEYHYHGDLPDLVLEDGSTHSRIYGYAADGFPIYYKYGYKDPDPTSPDTTIVELKSSYQLRSGARSDVGVAGQDYPSGNHDDAVDNGDGIGGAYIQDYEYVENTTSDAVIYLDQCNGRYGITPEYPDGTYYYVITADFPITPNCFAGTPNEDFKIGN